MKVNIQIAPMKSQQVRQVARLFHHGLAHDFSYFPSNYLKITARSNSAVRLFFAHFNPARTILLATIDQTPAGFTISQADENGVHFLFWLYVHPQFRGRGLGKKLIETIQQTADQSDGKLIRLATHAHREFYNQLGFRENQPLNFKIGEIPMVIMEKSLS